MIRVITLILISLTSSSAAFAECYDFVMTKGNALPQTVGPYALSTPATQLCFETVGRMISNASEEVVLLKDSRGELMKASATITYERRFGGDGAVFASLQKANIVVLDPKTRRERVQAVDFRGERITIVAGSQILYPNAKVREVVIGSQSFYIFAQPSQGAPQVAPPAQRSRF